MIVDLKDRLDFTITERNTLYNRVVDLTTVVQKATAKICDLTKRIETTTTERNEDAERLRNREFGMGAGFGAGAITAVYFSLNAAWTVVCISIGAITGAIIGDAATKKTK